MCPLWFFHLYITSSATTALSTLCQGRLYSTFIYVCVCVCACVRVSVCIYIYIYICMYIIPRLIVPHTIHWLLQSATKQLLYINELIACQLQLLVVSYDPFCKWAIQYFFVDKHNWKGKRYAYLWIIHKELNFVANWSLQVHNSAPFSCDLSWLRAQQLK